MKYKTATIGGIKEVDGETFLVGEYTCGISGETITDKWGLYEEFTVTELSTGMKVCSDLDQDAVIKEAHRLFRENEETKFIARAKASLALYGMKFPLNV